MKAKMMIGNRFTLFVRTLATLLAVAMASLGVLPNSQAETRPNVILIMADDVSWEAFGCYGAEDYLTPNLDDLASKGVRFQHCYSTPICTTSRVQLMTGQYNFRNYTHFGYLNPNQKTFAQLLKAAGYQTAIAGKWQLNGLTNQLPGYESSQRPREAGFDEYMLWQLTKEKATKNGGGERFWSPVLEHNGRLLTSQDTENQFGPDLLCDFVCDFIDRNQSAPYFVYYPMCLVHDPFVPTPDTIGDGDRSHAANKPNPADKKKNFVAMVQYMDKLVGRIVDKVNSLGQSENTLILFTADNGTNVAITSRWQGQLIKGGKGGMTDMGTHVPLIASWQGHTPEGAVLADLVDFTDFYPTLAEAAGVRLEQGDPRDGRSFLPQVMGQAGNPREWVFCHYQPYWNQQPGQFVRTGQYKLYRDGRFFDIAQDLSEAKAIPEGSSDAAALAARSRLSRVIEQAPPAPVEVGSATTLERPIYPDWKQLGGQRN